MCMCIIWYATYLYSYKKQTESHIIIETAVIVWGKLYSFCLGSSEVAIGIHLATLLQQSGNRLIYSKVKTANNC